MYYFAYASSLNHKQMAERCPGNKPKFIATLPNYKLIFSGWSRKWKGPTATIKPVKGEKVIGGVYEVTEADLRKLDKHEDCPAIYQHLKVTVWTDGGDSIETITYIMIDQSSENKPSQEYLSVIKQGYTDWQII